MVASGVTKTVTETTQLWPPNSNKNIQVVPLAWLVLEHWGVRKTSVCVVSDMCVVLCPVLRSVKRTSSAFYRQLGTFDFNFVSPEGRFVANTAKKVPAKNSLLPCTPAFKINQKILFVLCPGAFISFCSLLPVRKITSLSVRHDREGWI